LLQWGPVETSSFRKIMAGPECKCHVTRMNDSLHLHLTHVNASWHIYLTHTNELLTQCNILQHNTTHCNTLQLTRTSRIYEWAINTAQHAATHYNSHVHVTYMNDWLTQ